MHSRLYLYLQPNSVFYNLQFGFRNGHSTTYALLEITEKIGETCDKGFFSCGVFFLISKKLFIWSKKLFIW